jgi:UPF0716 family protein affecting phage T7 exclusion
VSLYAHTGATVSKHSAAQLTHGEAAVLPGLNFSPLGGAPHTVAGATVEFPGLFPTFGAVVTFVPGITWAAAVAAAATRSAAVRRMAWGWLSKRGCQIEHRCKNLLAVTTVPPRSY